MGVRPPTNGSDEPESIEFGIAALDARLEDSAVSFPASRDELVDELGDEPVPYDAHGNAVALEEAMAKLDRREFESRQELLNVLHPVFEEYRTRASNSVVKQFRSLLPF